MELEDDGPPGVPEWVVTYGDMMSLLLTFFIMLVSLSEVVADQKYRAIIESLHQNMGYDYAPVNPPGKNFPHNSLIEKMTKLGSWVDNSRAHKGIKHRAMNQSDHHDLRVYRTREGVGIQVGKTLYFEKEFEPEVMSEVDQEGRDLLSDALFDQDEVRRIAKELIGKPNKIEIRAHCSPDVIDSKEREVCYHRAMAVYEILVEAKVKPDRIRLGIAGSAMPPRQEEFDTQIPNFNRVEVMIMNVHTDAYVGPRR